VTSQKLLNWFVSGRMFILLAKPVLAHHGGPAYDTTPPSPCRVLVKEFHFIQPHPLIAPAVKDDKGTVVNGLSK